MNLIRIQLAAIQRDQLEKSRTKRPIWSKRRKKVSTLNPWDYYERPDREDTREREREYPNPYDELEQREPAEYPFHDFNYGP